MCPNCTRSCMSNRNFSHVWAHQRFQEYQCYGTHILLSKFLWECMPCLQLSYVLQYDEFCVTRESIQIRMAVLKTMLCVPFRRHWRFWSHRQHWRHWRKRLHRYCTHPLQIITSPSIPQPWQKATSQRHALDCLTMKCMKS